MYRFTRISLLFLILLGPLVSYAQATFNSNTASGNWAVAGSWSLTSGSDVDGIPDNDDDVTILNGHIIAVSDGAVPPSTHEVRNIVINSGGTLRANSGTTVRTLNVFGNLTISSGGTYTVNPVGAAVHFLNIAGNFTNNGGTFTPLSGTVSLVVTFNGSGAQAINGTSATQTFNNIIVNKTVGTTVSVSGSTTTLNVANLTQTQGNFTAPATLNATGTIILTTGTYTAGANTNIGGDFTNNGGTFTHSSGTVTFNGTVAQAINGTAASQTFGNIIVNKTVGTTLSVSGSTTTLGVANLTQTQGNFAAPATLNTTGTIILTTGTYTAGANTNIGGDFTDNGGTFTHSSGTVTFNGTGAQAINGTVASQTFNNIVVNKTVGTTLTVGGSTTTLNVANLTETQGNFTAPSTLNATGTITLTAGTYTAGANTTVGGNFTNNGGTFTHSSGTVTFNGAGAQAINGTAASQTFGNVIVNKTVGTTLSVSGSTTTLSVANLTETQGNFTAPATLNATGTIILTTGTYTAGANTNIGGDFTNNGATFTHSSGTVTFNGTGAQAINGTPASQTFNNIIVNKTAGTTLTVGGSTTTLNVANFTETQGNFTAPTTLNATGTITLTAGTYTAGANTNVGGNFTNNGGTFTHSSGTITFNGAGAQAINGSAASQTFNNVIVNKTVGTTLSVSGSTTTLSVANLTETQGNFTAPATLNATGTILLTAGTYTAGSNTNIGGDFTNNSGAFTHSSGTVTFNGTAQLIGGSSGTTFNNVTTSGTSATSIGIATTVSGNLSIGNGTSFTIPAFNFTVTGTSTVGGGTSGSLNITSATGVKTFTGLVTVAAGATWNNSANSPVNFRGGITNGGTFTAGTGLHTFTTSNQAVSGILSIPNFDSNVIVTNNGTLTVSTSISGSGSVTQGASSTLNLGGALSITTIDALASANTVVYQGANQTLYPITYQNLTINQSGGQAFAGGNFEVDGILNLTNRNLNLIGSNTLTFGPSASMAGGPFSSSKMIIAATGSEVLKVFSGAGSFKYEVGENTGSLEYSPITINSAGASTIGVYVVDAKHPNNSNTNDFLTRYWNISSTATVTADVTANYIASAADIFGSEGSIKPGQLNGIFNQLTNPWVKFPTVFSAGTLTVAGATLTASQVSSFTGITSADPTVSITGGGVTICSGNPVALNAPVVGGDPTIIYSWSPAAGLSATTVANPTASPTVTTNYIVTIRDGNGIVATNNSTITVDQPPTTSAAGPDQNVCVPAATLAANNPIAVGTGVWSFAPGGNPDALPLTAFSNTALYNSTFTGTAGQVYILRWTISNGVCTASTDDVQIRFYQAPTTAAAGSDQTGAFAVCGTSTPLAGNSPLIGTGLWSVSAGAGGSFVNATSPTTTFNGVAGTTYTLTWTISNGTCIPSTDNVDISFLQPPTVSAAGPDQNICNTVATLAANNPIAVGTGVWSFAPGGNPDALPLTAFSNTTLYNSTFTGTAGQTYILRWTITNGVCGNTFDDVTLVNNATASVADAGVNITQCNNSTFTMNAVVPSPGSGLWSVQLGSATITNATSPTTTITAIAAGTSATLRWTVGNGVCGTTFEDIILANTAAAPVAAAGIDQTLCNTSTFTLAGNAAAPGTGAWSIQSGPGTVTTPGAFNSQITGVTAGAAPTVVRWTITNGVCGNTFDDVTLVNNATASVADAGVNITQCNNSTFTMNAVVPSPGSGLWSVQLGSATITNATSPTTTITAIAAGTSATLRWTVGNGVCGTTFEDIILANTAAAPVAAAGIDQTLCNTSTFTLAGNAAAPGTGAWSIQSGPGTVTTPGAFNSQITGVTAGAAPTVVRWTITNGVCGNTFDDVTLVNNATASVADAGVNITQCNNSTFTMNAVVPSPGSGLWSVQLGSATITNATSPTTTITAIAAGTSATLRWTVGNGVCGTTFEDIILANTAAAPVAAAGIDQTLCNTSTFTLAGNAAAPGTGAWSIQSGPGTVTTPGAFNSQITGVTAGAAPTVVRWTITNGVCGNTFDDVTLVNNATASVADAGVNITQCNNSTFTMNAVVPSPGSGLWSVQLGSATITNATSPTTTITAIAAGTSATLRWTVGNGVCGTTFEDIILANTAAAPVAAAGIDQTLCNTSTFTLAGNAAAPGTGAWSIQSGPGTVTTPGAFNSQITGVTAGAAPTVVRWTITNGVCGNTFDDVTLVNNAIASVADAGVNITQCNNSTFTMNAVVPSPGSGLWSVQLGSATITNATSPTTTITAIAAGTSATLRWTVGNGVCGTTFEDIILANTAAAPVAAAGIDQTLCNTSTFTLAGNAAAPGTGAWSIQSGPGTVTTPGQFNSQITGVTAGAAPTVVRWTITNGVCGNTFDDVTLVNNATASVADAGVNITQCNNSTFTMNAVVPSPGSGLWSVQLGSATITNATSPTTTITAIAAGTSATLRWTVGNGVCGTTFEDIILANTAAAPVAAAGIDQTLCNTSTFTLAGNAAAPGTGAWSIQSGPGTVTTPGQFNSQITGVTAGAAPTVVRWTITNGVCGNTFDDVTLVNNATASVADAGVNITQCNNSTFTMNAVVPSPGSGLWSVQLGSATITNATSPTTTITAIAAGTSATLRWTVGNGVCGTTFEDIILANTAAAPVAAAGIDQTLCNTSTFTLAGNAAAPGTGAWSIQSGPGTVTTPGAFNSQITGVTAGAAPTVVRWTITNGVCGNTFDDVTLVNNATASVADAGVNITQCNNSTFTMNAVVPSPGSGLWSVQLGSATITNATSPTTTITAIAAGTSATLRWTVGNGVCGTTFEDIILANTAAAPVAAAGIDQTLCNTSTFTLAGNAAAPGTGAWSIQSGPGTVTTPGAFNSQITGVTAGAAPTVVRWTITNGVCGNTFDDVTLVNNATASVADAGVNITQCNNSTFTMNAVVPSPGSGLWSVQLGSATITNATSPTTTITAIAAGTSATLRWTVGNGVCGTTFEDIILANTAAAPVAAAGIDQTLCNTSTFTLAGNAAAPGTGAWSIQSGPGTVTTPGAFNSQITGVTAGAAPTVVRWTITNGVCGNTFDDVTLVNNATASVADAGVNITQCNNSTFTMNAVVPSPGSGLWSVQLGSATITNATSPTTTITAIAAGTSATLRWTVGNGVCGTTFEDIILANTAAAPVAAAGIDQTLCNTSTFTLAGNAAAPGTGAWSIQSGPGTVTTPGAFNSQITGVTAGAAPTVVRWTITNGVCGNTFDDVTLINLLPPTVDAGSSSETCQGVAFNFSTQTTVATASNYSSVSWSHPGTGTLFNANTLTPTYQPGVGEVGSVNFTLAANGVAPCTSVNDFMTLTITPAPTADAGAPTGETCETTPFIVSGASATNSAGILWTESGFGSITAGATTPTPTYTPVAADGGTIVTLTMTVTGNGSCAVAVDTKALTVTDSPTADAGTPTGETCVTTPFTVSGASATNVAGILWTHDGAGTLTNATTLTPTYTPIAADAGNIVTLTLTIDGNGSCVDAVDTKALTITKSPTADAGAPTGETCETTPFIVSGASATNSAGILWTESGFGSITAGATTPTPTYTPVAADGGTIVTLTMTVTGNGSCAVAVDTKALTVTDSPTADAGTPTGETCVTTPFTVSGASATNVAGILWTHDGAGTLTNATTLTPTYTPIAADAGNIVTLTLTIDGNGSCVDAVDTKALTITKSPTVGAGSDAETCQGVSYNFSTQSTPATASNYLSILWTTPGTGVLTNANTPTPNYAPGAGETGNVVFTLTATGNGSCTNINDQMTLAITPSPIVNAGSDAETCKGVTYSFTNQSIPASAANYASILWTHSGTGTLFNANTLTPTYQPGPTEAGNVTFTLTVTGNGSCLNVNDQMTLVITPSQIISAGSDSETCQGVAFNFSTQSLPASGSNYSSLLWAHTGTGALANPNSTAPTYTPGVGETGTVTFTLTAFGNGSCLPINDGMVLKITPATIVNAGSDQEICQGGSYNFANQSTLASASNFSALVWSHNGSGTLFNGNTLTPTYFATPGETGVVTFTLTALPNGSCTSSNNTVLLTITPAPVANAGSDDAVCEGTPTFNFSTRSVIASSANGTLAWSHNGTGSLSSSSAVSPVYTVGAGDFGTTVTFTLTVTSGSAVCAADVDQFTLQVNRTALVSVPSPSITVCEPAQINLSGSVGGSATSGAWSRLSGGGTLSVSSVTGLTVTAVYDTVSIDVGNTLQFRLTSNDPDGTGPCTTVFTDLSVTIDRSAKVFAGPDFAVCEYQNINLNGSFSGSTSSVLWSGGSGAPQFGNVTSPITTYTLTPAERAANGLSFTFTLTTDDPVGVCSSASDQVKVTVSDTLSFVTITNLGAVYQEDDASVFLGGVPGGGIFTGPGIVAGTNEFNPANANIGTNVIKYTYTDPATSCQSIPRKSTIVNPVTTIDFRVLISVAPDVFATEDVNGFPQICSDIGDIRLRGNPDVNDPLAGVPTDFSSLQATLDTRIIQKPDGFYYIVTDGLPAGVYDIIYTYTNEFGATTFLQKQLTVFSSPKAIIDVTNSCVSSVLNFTESSVITGSNPSGATLTNWVWGFGNGIGSNLQSPSYQYPGPGNYNITLEVTTSEGCKHDTIKAIRVGPTPTMNFNWSAFCNGNDTKFVDATNPGISTIIQYTWDFKDGFTITGPAGGSVPVGTNGGRTTGTFTNPNHKYDTFGQYDVMLTVATNDGCVNDTTKRAFILSYGTPSPTVGYFEDFEAGPGTWVGTRADISIPTDTSWVYGLPSGVIINSASSGANAWWTGRNTSVVTSKSNYFSNEKSAVIGPCVNLVNIKRPMISIDYWSDSEDGRDGAVVQYSTNGGVTWQTIGDDAGAGLNWYDGRALTGNPGLQSLGQFGWSTSNYTTGGWKTARYNLDQIPKVDRSEVIFRVAFGSNNDNQFNDQTRTIEYSGFAFDNVFIGEKQRNVLVEYFTNAGINPSVNDYLNNLYSNQFLLKDSSDFFKIQYHIANPSTDPINQSNPVDPAARSLFYGISQPPVGIMDGVLGNYFGTVFNGDQTKITATEVDRRALESPLFDIQINELPTTSDSINLDVQFRYIDQTPLNSPVTLQIGLVEANVSGNINVVRKMLMGGEGKTINIPWTFGTTTNVPIKSIIDVPIGIANNNLWVVAFVQDRNTKRIHQAWMVKSAQKDAATIVGVEDPILESAKGIQIFPNPASRQLNFTAEYRLLEGYTYSIVDQRGVTMLSGELQQDIFTPQQVELNNLTNGVYFVIISRGSRALIHRKIAVLNQN